MRLRVTMFVILCCFVVGVPSAYAGDVRFPQQGYPAISFHIPDDWTTRIDDDGNMIVTAADHSTALSLTLAEYDDSLDTLAAEALKVAKGSPPQQPQATSISGLSGYVYRSAMVSDSGITLNLKLVAIRVDAKHVATCTLITNVDISQTDMAAAETVLDSLSIATSP